MAGRKRSACSVLLALTFLLTSCASTKLVETWKDNQFKGPAFKKIMVVSLMKQPDTRQRVEDEFAGQLNARGVHPVTCYSCIPDLNNLTREEIVRAVGKTGVEVPIQVDLEIMKYVDQRGEKKLKFDPSLEFKDPMGIQARF